MEGKNIAKNGLSRLILKKQLHFLKNCKMTEYHFNRTPYKHAGGLLMIEKWKEKNYAILQWIHWCKREISEHVFWQLARLVWSDLRSTLYNFSCSRHVVISATYDWCDMLRPVDWFLRAFSYFPMFIYPWHSSRRVKPSEPPGYHCTICLKWTAIFYAFFCWQAAINLL